MSQEPTGAEQSRPEEEATTPPPVPSAPQSSASTSDGLDPKVGGLLAYLLFGWIGGLIMFFTQKHPEVRFHGAQSVLVSIALFAVGIALSVLGSILAFIPFLGWVAALILSVLLPLVLGIGGFVLWVILCIKGYNLEHFKLPFIGDMAEKWAAS